jgi:tetratricopeptide (TPR) repeat protein
MPKVFVKSTIIGLVLGLGSVIISIPVVRGEPTDHAIATWTDRVQQNAPDEYALVQLGDALMQKARDTADVSYYNRAEAHYKQALTLRSTNVGALTGLAWVSGVRHEFEQSMEWARQAVAIEPQNHAAYGLLGDAALEIGNYEEALGQYQKMLDIRPDLSSYSRGAHLLFVTGDTRRAMALMHRAIAAGAPYAENTAWCQAQLALMLWSTGALLPAEQLLHTALAAAPHNYHVLAAMGKIKAAQQDYDTAIDYYKRASAIAPQLEVIIALGDIYRLTGRQEAADKQDALVDVMHQLNIANGVRDDIAMARFYADRERHLSEALQIAEAVYKTRQNVFVADTLAWCYYKNGRYEEARKAIHKALSQKTPDAMILFHAGMIYAKLGHRPTAQKYLYQALSLQANFHPVYAKVAADTLEHLGTRQLTSEHVGMP